MRLGGSWISSKRFRLNRFQPDEHLTSALRGLNCQLFRRLLQTFFSHATYMNGLSLEFEGSTGQNEPGIFRGAHALLTIPVCKRIVEPESGCVLRATSEFCPSNALLRHSTLWKVAQNSPRMWQLALEIRKLVSESEIGLPPTFEAALFLPVSKGSGQLTLTVPTLNWQLLAR